MNSVMLLREYHIHMPQSKQFYTCKPLGVQNVLGVYKCIHTYFITTSPKRIFRGNTVKVKIIIQLS